jgi:hypothetical protein
VLFAIFMPLAIFCFFMLSFYKKVEQKIISINGTDHKTQK